MPSSVGSARPSRNFSGVALLVLYAALVPFGSAVGLPVPLPPPFDTFSSIVGAAFIATGLAQLILVPRRAGRLVPALPLFVVFTGIVVLTHAWTIDRVRTGDEAVLLVSLVALYAVALLLPVEPRHVRSFETAVIVGAVIAAAIGLLAFASGAAPTGKSGVPRFGITGDDPNHTAAGLLLPLVLAASRTLGDPPPRRLMYGATTLALIAGIVLTGSRGGLVAAIAAIVALAAPKASVRHLLGAGAVVAVGATLALVMAPDPLAERIVSPGTTGRTDIWRLGLSACDDYCLVGSGWGTFPDVYKREFRRATDVGGFRDEGLRAHNIWLQALIETGIAGLAALVASYAAAIVGALRLPDPIRGPPFAALAGLAVASSLVSNLHFKYFWLVLVYAGLVEIAHARPPAIEPPAGTLAPAASRALTAR